MPRRRRKALTGQATGGWKCWGQPLPCFGIGFAYRVESPQIPGECRLGLRILDWCWPPSCTNAPNEAANDHGAPRAVARSSRFRGDGMLNCPALGTYRMRNACGEEGCLQRNGSSQPHGSESSTRGSCGPRTVISTGPSTPLVTWDALLLTSNNIRMPVARYAHFLQAPASSTGSCQVLGLDALSEPLREVRHQGRAKQGRCLGHAGLGATDHVPGCAIAWRR